MDKQKKRDLLQDLFSTEGIIINAVCNDAECKKNINRYCENLSCALYDNCFDKIIAINVTFV